MPYESKETSNTTLTNLLNQSYKYGFATEIEKEIFEKGLNENVIRAISQKRDEPDFLLKFRLKAYNKWKQMKCPEWHILKFSEINYQAISYYT